MPKTSHTQRVLIFIVAYNAEQHIEKVLNRIPPSFLEKYDYEVLIIDDSSGDNTFEVAKKYQQSNLSMNLKVLYNPINQGYGGNQKLGYRYAILNEFDAVVLLHGDGQYAPELVEEMISPILFGEAKAVFGSRMMNKKDALKGGMPYYKFIGNIILTRIQNWILHSNLYEFHSGYRAYSVSALSLLPFERNSDDFHFDTQIIIQLLLAKFKIKEIPIPTFYGDEICHVNGIRYGWNVIKASIQSKLHRMNIFYKMEYDVDDGTPHYDLKLGYTSSHTMALENTPAKSRVLD
nr:glycosyltransferase family 2 protein [Saprospiraceae bacterium]